MSRFIVHFTRSTLQFALLTLSWTTPHACAADPPNVVLIVTDDQGYGDLGCHGNPTLKTPHLDRLYHESVRLTNYHVSPTCSPTRSALLTGHWTNRTGVWHTIMGRSLLRENEVTMGQMFLDNGYATGMFGKWHLGDNYPYRPEDRGYAEVFRHGGGGVGQTPDYWDNAYFNGTYFRNSQPERAEGFCTDVWFDNARRFITQQQQAGQPFLAYIATNAPHGPMHAPRSLSEPYQHLGTPVANFLGMIAGIDENVGRLRRFLDEQGLTDNTIFIFTTDNGTAAGDEVFNAGMRGKKGSEYDGGHRVPFFIYWPVGGLVGPRDIKSIAAHVDVLPTLLDLCGIAPPAEVKFDGRSIKSLLDASSEVWPDRMLVTDSQRVKDPIKWRKSAVMTDRWRLVNGTELYDMFHDPGQVVDVAPAYPAQKDQLREFYEKWWAELEPTFQQDCPIHLGTEQEDPSRLTSHDWITGGGAPWNQAHIRQAFAHPDSMGHWIVKIVADGMYRIRLRRWPAETDTEINAPLAPGDDVPGAAAFRARPGIAIQAATAELRVGDVTTTSPVEPGAKEVVFELPLSAGETEFEARFLTAEGDVLGAYYAYVSRL